MALLGLVERIDIAVVVVEFILGTRNALTGGTQIDVVPVTVLVGNINIIFKGLVGRRIR